MSSKRIVVVCALMAVMIGGAGLTPIIAAGQEPANLQWMAVKRQTLAIRYKNDDSTTVNMAGSSVAPRAAGKAEVKHNSGRTRIKIEMDHLGNPQAIGPYYTTFVLWAIAPEGQADNLAELPIKPKINIDVTTNFQTFGLIITAEPHSAVKLPGPVIVAENALRKGTEGGIQTSSIEYSGGSPEPSRTAAGTCENGAVATQYSPASSNQSERASRSQTRSTSASSSTPAAIHRRAGARREGPPLAGIPDVRPELTTLRLKFNTKE